MYDIYIDEEKVSGNIGFLVVKNTPVIQQSLLNFRQRLEEYSEVKYSGTNNFMINLYKNWIKYFFSLEKENYISFYRKKWNLKLKNKEEVISNFINELKEKLNTKNFVVILDFESSHKNINIENLILKETKVCRCFHFNSKTTDLLQLCDLLLGCSIKENNLINLEKYLKLKNKIILNKRCTKGELKNFIGKYFFEKNKQFNLKKIFLE